MIISSMVGINNRSTMDIDTTIRNINLSADDISRVLAEIISIEIDDGIAFRVKSISDIMDEAEYPGIRAMLEATLENMRTPLKIDFSTGDVITPKEIEYEYKLMFENRSISILAYNTETILAEKLETVISRSTANTRLRDFYDLRILYDTVEYGRDRLWKAKRRIFRYKRKTGFDERCQEQVRCSCTARKRRRHENLMDKLSKEVRLRERIQLVRYYGGFTDIL